MRCRAGAEPPLASASREPPAAKSATELERALKAAIKQEVRRPGRSVLPARGLPRIRAQAAAYVAARPRLAHAQDYARCAALRDELASLRASDPLASAQARLAAAIAAESWEEAALLRDAVAALSPPPPPPPQMVPCSSECVTAGVRVTVKSQYMREHSDLSRGVYAFAYDVQFTNESAVPVQLWGRHWIIRDATGRVETVRGNGVVGQQPRLEPGQSYQYSSFCPLRTASGTMEGAFEFITSTVGADEPPARFQVRVARFGLSPKGEPVPLPPMAEESAPEPRAKPSSEE